MILDDKIDIMIVDDSSIMRSLLERIISQDSSIHLSNTATNGQEALEAIKKNRSIDIVLLDIQMPVMGGLQAIPLLLKEKPKLKIIVVSSVSSPNAYCTMEALSLGAVDYIEKPNNREDLKSFERDLLVKIRALVPYNKFNCSSVRSISPSCKNQTESSISLKPVPFSFNPAIIAIASSTGGPKALVEILRKFSEKFLSNKIILITQHIKKDFVPILVKQILDIKKVKCKEAVDGELMEKGTIYIAPGDFHMEVIKKARGLFINLSHSAPENFSRPSADPMFSSLSKVSSNVLAVVLTGIGVDGLKGAQKIIDRGGVVIAQDKESSIVWGMPGAVSDAKICSAVLPLNEIATYIEKRLV